MGVSKIVLDQNLPYQQIWLNVGEYLYAGVYVNEGLTITVDAQKTTAQKGYIIGDGIGYNGKDGEVNTVINKYIQFKKQEKAGIFEKLRGLRDEKNKTSTGFISKIDTIRLQLAQINKEFIVGYPNYAWAVENETLSDFYNNLCVVYWGDVMPNKLFQDISKHEPYFTSNESVLFYKYLQTYISIKKNEQKAKDLEETLTWFDKTFTPQKSDLLKLCLLENAKPSFAQSFPLIINSIQTKWCKVIAKDELAKAITTQHNIDSLFSLSKKLETTNIGKPLLKLPFEAELYQIDTLKDVNDLIYNLKSKFTGKALIIDFWATWCVPCLSDLPFSKNIHEANKDLPIAYIYICTSRNSNMNIWKNKVAEFRLPGTHIFMNEKVINQLKRTLDATNGFPAYVVINADGKVNTKAISRMEVLNRDSIKQATGLKEK
ncbi:TlpA family protein disulfide reductase [Mucilaginibacter sp. RB4R14]|uniref:TlpA family protein disulfide reductase n=1 Tax=Mucilaginibacter aurantiaciroseus TaxID=2949308 RepID=UPI00209065FB|nr:TlpA disulfide reductase family protein [Mucilaginibacter aurantiaciroseus]MCO5934913.1 TlpA family protein disulfide reductase [Mucilaginibacter aurantiaciroseus]